MSSTTNNEIVSDAFSVSPPTTTAHDQHKRGVHDFYGGLHNERLYQGIPMLCVHGLHELVADKLDQQLGGARGKVLDIGCGQGALALRLAQRGHDVHAVDEVDACRCKESIQFHRGRAEEVSVDQEYDAILFIEVAEHLSDPWSVMEASWRGLKPGGILCFSTPNVDSLFSRAWFLMTGRHWYFEEQNLRQDGHQTPIHDFQVRFHLERLGFQLLERAAPADRRVAMGATFRSLLALARRYASVKKQPELAGPVSLYIARKPL